MATSSHFRGDSEPDTECAKNLHHRADARVALTGQRLVQTWTPQLSFLGNSAHAHGARDVANGLDEQLRIVFFQCCLQILNNHGRMLGGEDLREVDWRNAKLVGADLSGALLYGADLSNADLTGALLVGADLYGATLSGAVLRDADLRNAKLRAVALSNADLTGADLSDADLNGATYDAETRWPAGFEPPPS